MGKKTFHTEWFNEYKAGKRIGQIAIEHHKDKGYMTRTKQREKWDEIIRKEEDEINKEVARLTAIQRTKLISDSVNFAKEMLMDLQREYRELKEDNKKLFVYLDAQGNKRLNVGLYTKFVDKLMPVIFAMEPLKDAEGVTLRVIALPEATTGEY